jgi:preprotein translocase subunit YajC
MRKKISILSACMALAALASPVFAATQPTAAHPSFAHAFTQMLPMLLIFLVVFYFLLVRPQSKKAKAHRNLMSSLNAGDEVSTAGGIIAKIKSLNEQYAILSLSNGGEMMIQRSSISSVLPKGTMDTI